MAAALSKNCLTRIPHDRRTFSHYVQKRSVKFSIPNLNSTVNPVRQPGSFLRFTHSIFRKKNERVFPSNGSSQFSSRASSSLRESGLVSWYLGVLKTRPVITKSVTSSLIYAAADVSSQVIAGEILEQYDSSRTLRMAGYGMLILGPSVHHWYNFMSRIFPKRDLISTFKKMALGQMLFGPAMTAVFFSVNAALQGESGSEIIARLKRDLLPTMINGIMYWPVCDFVTFKFIPVHLQPLVTNSFSYLWTVYMTYIASLGRVGATI